MIWLKCNVKIVSFFSFDKKLLVSDDNDGRKRLLEKPRFELSAVYEEIKWLD